MLNNWWKNKIAYQIYPKSFCDSNGDGIGDIQGIISKLDYLKELGINIIWISPIYKSPFADQGYDISDYYAIDPLFGTMEDFDQLVAQVKKRHMYLIMDLVVNHCSDEHEWFQKAIKDPEGPYGKYFYIEKMKEDKVPNNLRSHFGGSCWEPIPGTDYCYFHAFHVKQPDLNWENPQLRREIYDMMNFWLGKGINGFRVDAIMNIKKELPWHDYPTDRNDGLSFVGNMYRNTTAGAFEFLQEMNRETVDKYDDTFTVGEVFELNDEFMQKMIGKGGAFSTIFDFSSMLIGMDESGWHKNKGITPQEYIQNFIAKQTYYQEQNLYLANIIENHDEPRGVSHYLSDQDRCPDSKKMLAGIYFFGRGIPFIFQGQEIGMENGSYSSIEDFDDINTIGEYQNAISQGVSPEDALKAANKMSRDNARSPMQWNASPEAGFTSGKPWLKVHDDYKEINVESQLNDSDSLFHFYQRMIDLKKNPVVSTTLTTGAIEFPEKLPDRVLAFTRKGSNQALFVVANWQNQEADLEIPGQMLYIWLNNQKKINIEGNRVHLAPYQFAILEYFPGDELPG